MTTRTDRGAAGPGTAARVATGAEASSTRSVPVVAFAACLLAAASALSAERVDVEVLRVTDGDTVRVALPDGRELPVRLQGYDTPEVGQHAECLAEEMLGQVATRILRTTLESHPLTLATEWETDRWGRLLARGLVSGEVDLAEIMIDTGLALPYDGQGPRPDWCAP